VKRIFRPRPISLFCLIVRLFNEWTSMSDSRTFWQKRYLDRKTCHRDKTRRRRTAERHYRWRYTPSPIGTNSLLPAELLPRDHVHPHPYPPSSYPRYPKSAPLISSPNVILHNFVSPHANTSPVPFTKQKFDTPPGTKMLPSKSPCGDQMLIPSRQPA